MKHTLISIRLCEFVLPLFNLVQFPDFMLHKKVRKVCHFPYLEICHEFFPEGGRFVQNMSPVCTWLDFLCKVDPHGAKLIKIPVKCILGNMCNFTKSTPI